MLPRLTQVTPSSADPTLHTGLPEAPGVAFGVPSVADRLPRGRRASMAVGSAALLAVLSGCATDRPQGLGQSADTFHDTRLRIALIADDRQTLQSDFKMTSEPTWPERFAAAFGLPVAAAAEAATWPVAAAFRAYHDTR